MAVMVPDVTTSMTIIRVLGKMKPSLEQEVNAKESSRSHRNSFYSIRGCHAVRRLQQSERIIIGVIVHDHRWQGGAVC